jgi:hypothetical protein
MHPCWLADALAGAALPARHAMATHRLTTRPLATGADYACGFAAWPTFGMAAMKYTWNFDWQMNYVGAGARLAGWPVGWVGDC